MAQKRLLATVLALLCAAAVQRLADARITEASVVRDDRRVILLANPFGCAPLMLAVGTRAQCAPVACAVHLDLGLLAALLASRAVAQAPFASFGHRAGLERTATST